MPFITRAQNNKKIPIETYTTSFLHLIRLNFSDAEIEVFVSEYDADGNELFDVDEIQAIDRRVAIAEEPEEM